MMAELSMIPVPAAMRTGARRNMIVGTEVCSVRYRCVVRRGDMGQGESENNELCVMEVSD